ncbi:EAL domain-containing protein [Arthrobacter sp. TB 26]|uniref:EAL domain-containing protein n=1 Tax=Arthrobacter sp. TB 26 TaxID=494420 RepID=UPI0004296B0A|nr:EAL domain-containing protein [Arthrobacter sp. TB 26]
MADPSPGQAHIRELLREHLAAHPGRPDIALAEHLLALRSLTGLPPESKALLSGPGKPARDARESMSLRIEKVLQGRMLVTAFQPIRELSTGRVVGVEAFTRFVSDGSDPAGEWFAAAAKAQLGSELELAALESALNSAVHLPAHLYVALKLSPATCLDPLLPGLLEESMVAVDRVVLELTDALADMQPANALADMQPAALADALAPLRKRGLRLAVDHVGSHFDSIRQIRQICPDFIKLDRNLVAGIETDPLRHAFGEVMTDFAEQLGAVLIAEGIETSDELAAVAGLGVTTGQGYHLGRPTVRLRDWAGWKEPVLEFRPLAGR